jgi:hypothetical protein
MRQEMSENLKILENRGKKVHLLRIDTCLSLKEIMQWVLQKEQELLILREHQSSCPVFSGANVAQSLFSM